VNTAQQPQLASAFAIRSIPTLMIFRDHLLLFAEPGLLPENVLEDLIRQVRGLDMDEVRRKAEESQPSAAPTGESQASAATAGDRTARA
jgi:thioredoxin 1